MICIDGVLRVLWLLVHVLGVGPVATPVAGSGSSIVVAG